MSPSLNPFSKNIFIQKQYKETGSAVFSRTPPFFFNYYMTSNKTCKIVTSINGISPKYSRRNSPPYPANACRNVKKRGNDGTMYLSKKRGTSYRWVKDKSTVKERTDVEKKTTKDSLSDMAHRYHLTTSGSSKKILAERIFYHYGRMMNAKDFSIIEPYLSRSFMRKVKTSKYYRNKSKREKDYIKRYFIPTTSP